MCSNQPSPFLLFFFSSFCSGGRGGGRDGEAIRNEWMLVSDIHYSQDARMQIVALRGVSNLGSMFDLSAKRAVQITASIAFALQYHPALMHLPYIYPETRKQRVP